MKEEAIDLHRKLKGKIEISARSKVSNRKDLSLTYTPGVAAVSERIRDDPKEAYSLTRKWNTIAIVTDGSAVLGLGDIGPAAALPVMEGKSVLLKEFADVDCFPICLNTKDVDEIVKTIKIISPGFGGILLEDISAPRCFEIESRLQGIGIPVFHDDQHGTATVVLAGLMNASRVIGRDMKDLSITINGAGAAGIAIVKLIHDLVKDITICDSKGIISGSRKDLNPYKKELLACTKDIDGSLSDALVGADVFIGVSAPGILTEDMVRMMAEQRIIFALSNPVPEIDPDIAEDIADIVATGRSDHYNQVNNLLAFPGLFRGALDGRKKNISRDMMKEAAIAMASMITPTRRQILPDPLDRSVAEVVAKAITSSRL